MAWHYRALDTLRRVLAELYPREPDQRRLVVAAGLREAAVSFDAAADASWHGILSYAAKQDSVDALLEVARGEFPRNELLRRAGEDHAPDLAQGPLPAREGPEHAGDVAEKIIGSESSLVPVAFLQRGLSAARAVVQVRLAGGTLGSGFLVPGNILLTNNHVIEDVAAASTATAIFNYQQTVDGRDEPTEVVALDPTAFFATSVADDWTAVRVAGDPQERWGALSVRRSGVKTNDRVNIIQHPGGGHKQLSLFANVAVFVGAGRVQYLTDTLPGSSGAPVFDREWSVVALHHSGGWIPEPGRSHRFLRNEGILIDVVLDGLSAAGHPL